MSTKEIDDRYWILKRMSEQLGGKSVPTYYYGVIQLPTEKAKQKLIAAAKRLGLNDVNKTGTLRKAFQFGEKTFQRLEVYIHTQLKPEQYGIRLPLIALDTFRGSPTT